MNHIVHLEQLFGDTMSYYRSGRNTQRYPRNAYIMRMDEILVVSLSRRADVVDGALFRYHWHIEVWTVS